MLIEKEETMTEEEILINRYKSGKRHNSFYIDMPYYKTDNYANFLKNEYKGYTYYIDCSGKLVQEII